MFIKVIPCEHASCATNRPAWRNHCSQGIKINNIEIKKKHKTKNIERKKRKPISSLSMRKHILGDSGAAIRDDRMFVVKVYLTSSRSYNNIKLSPRTFYRPD